jgi:hypothetical protein
VDAGAWSEKQAHPLNPGRGVGIATSAGDNAPYDASFLPIVKGLPVERPLANDFPRTLGIKVQKARGLGRIGEDNMNERRRSAAHDGRVGSD